MGESSQQGKEESRKRERKNVNSGCYILPAKPEGSACIVFGPKSALHISLSGVIEVRLDTKMSLPNDLLL